MKKLNKTIQILTVITVITNLLLAAIGLINNDIYYSRINRITRFELMGQDTITIVIAIIFLVLILFLDYNKIKTKIVWLGCLMYIFYINAYYSFGGVSSIYYLIYIALTGISLYIFIFIIIIIIKEKKYPVIGNKYPRKLLSAYFIICILMVAIIEINELITKTVIQKEIINPFYAFYVLDLGIIFPMIIIIAILNLKKSIWGHILSGVALLKIVTILPAVLMNDIFHKIYTGRFLDFTFDLIAIVISASGMIFLILYMKSIKNL
jgi:hypothetical protein